MQTIEITFNAQRQFFDHNKTRSYAFRVRQLEKLKEIIEYYETAILKALQDDLHKPELEAYTSEVMLVQQEIEMAISNIKEWMSPQKVKTPIILEPAKSFIITEPLGVVLIISPWNYPFQLVMSPLIGAIAAGNCVMIKPSEMAPNMSNLIAEMLEQIYPNEYVAVVQGDGAEIVPKLIKKFRFDHIFFTGSTEVGRKIAVLAAAHLTPVTLELGGKSPAIIDSTAKIEIAVQRLVAGKFFNAGQTCVAPDYLLVHEKVYDEVISTLRKKITTYFGDEPINSPDIAHIVNKKRFDTLVSYLSQGKVSIGGEYDEESLKIEPTVMEEVAMDSPIMKEEIFGPILPIIRYSAWKELIEIIRKNRYPLALYVYSEDQKLQNFIFKIIEFGGGCINQSIMHIVNPHLPFGGVGLSGMGQYHGKATFDLFSHKKSILQAGTKMDLPFRYPPYKTEAITVIKEVLKSMSKYKRVIGKVIGRR